MAHFWNSLLKHKLVSAILAVSALLAFVLRIHALVEWVSHGKPVDGSSVGTVGLFGVEAYGIQLVVIGILLGVVSKAPYTNERIERASKAVGQFHSAWQGVWWGWFFYYITAFAHALFKWMVWKSADSPYWEPIQTLFNNIQTIFLFGCYYVLVKPTVRPGDSKSSLRVMYTPLVVVIILLTLVHVLYAASHSEATAPSAHVTESGRLLFHLVSGMSSGIALALFVARLDSKYIDVPQWIIITLCAYALLQPTFILFISDEFSTFEGIVSAIALPLKLLLFYCVHWFLLQENKSSNSRSLFYFDSIRLVYESAEAKWIEFNEKYPPPEESLPPQPPSPKEGSPPQPSKRAAGPSSSHKPN